MKQTLPAKIPVDRYALAEIACDESISNAIVQTTFYFDGIHNTDLLLSRLLVRIVEIVPAERDAVFFAHRKPGDLEPAAWSDSGGVSRGRFTSTNRPKIKFPRGYGRSLRGLCTTCNRFILLILLFILLCQTAYR